MISRSAIRRCGVIWAAAIAAALLTVPWVQAQSAATGPVAADAAPFEPAFHDWLAALRDEARAKGISAATLDAALNEIAPLTRVLELDRRQPEFTLTFRRYLSRLVSDQRIARGRALLAEHRDLLEKIHAVYGVPPRYLIAFWGLETNFGDDLGGFRVIDALATLAFDRRRADFFRTQLLDALQIIDQGHIRPEAMTGSWAGAMGHMQFMPSTFIAHAVDYSGDGRKDIWNSLPDALSSAGNFLANLGWRRGEIWGREVHLPSNFDPLLASLAIRKSPAQWSALGVRRANGAALPQSEMQGAIVLPQGHKGPAFLVYDNFRIILHWNHSINYAISIGHLADRIIGLPPIATGQAAEHEPLSRDEMIEIQQLLNRLDFDAGSPDGLAGLRTRDAIRAFQKQQALPPDGYPDPALLRQLRLQVQKKAHHG